MYTKVYVYRIEDKYREDEYEISFRISTIITKLIVSRDTRWYRLQKLRKRGNFFRSSCPFRILE